MFENPFAPHYSIKDIESKLFISIPSKKHWFLTIFLGVWLAAWVIGEIVVGEIVVRTIFGNKVLDSSVAGTFILWLGIWTVGGVFAIYTFLWQIIGREEIEVTSYSIKISQVILMFRRSKEYASEYIKNLHISPIQMPIWFRSWVYWGIGGGIVVFDYDKRTIRMGSGIDEAEGKQIIAEIQQKYPQYKKQTQEQ